MNSYSLLTFYYPPQPACHYMYTNALYVINNIHRQSSSHVMLSATAQFVTAGIFSLLLD